MNDTMPLSIEQEIRLFLAVSRTASLATVDVATGQPHAANVQFVADEAWRLHWISSEKSLHSQQLVQQPRVAFTVYAHQDDPEQIRGLQMHGIAAAVTGEDRQHTLRLYANKYPFVESEPFRSAVLKQSLYRITPTWLRWIDNRRGFGWKIERRWTK